MDYDDESLNKLDVVHHKLCIEVDILFPKTNLHDLLYIFFASPDTFFYFFYN